MRRRLSLPLIAVLIAGSLAAPAAGRAAEPTPIAHWTFDETSGSSLVDASGNGHDGSISSAVGRTSEGTYGRALRFSGAPVSARADGTGIGADRLTVSMWIRSEVDQVNGAVLFEKGARGCDGPAYGIYVDHHGLVVRTRPMHGDGMGHSQFLTDMPDLWDGAWHHVSFTYTLSDPILRFYVDGLSWGGGIVGRINDTGLTSADFAFGSSAGGTGCDTPRFIGDIDDVRIYDVTLDMQQLGALEHPIPTVTRIYTRDDVDAMVFYKYTVEVEPIPAHGQVHVFELTDDREIRLDIAPTTIPRGAYEANFRFDSKGVHRIFARFVPGNPWLPSESEVVEQVVAGIPTESAIRVESAVEGQPIEIRVWVGASLTPYRGIVDLFDTTGDTPIHLGSMDLFEAHPDYLGLARFLLPARDPGTYRLEARYAGTDELYEPSEATGIMVVEPLPPLPPDIDPPTATAPSHRLISGVAISSGRATARLTWSGTDAASGVAGYMLEQQTDGGPWVTVSPSITSTTIDRLLTPQHRYRFRVTPVDAAGNTGAPATGPTFTVSRFSENNSDVKYSGSWKTSKNAVFWGGAARKSLSAGAKASLRFIGRSVAWVARTGPDRGKATVYVNGTRLATIDLYAPTYQRQRVVWAGSWSSAASRLVTIKVSGTSGRPRVDLDAFVTTN